MNKSKILGFKNFKLVFCLLGFSLLLPHFSSAITYEEIYKASLEKNLQGKVLGTTVQIFTLTEKFGVSHPEQIVDFDYSTSSLDPNSTCMLGPNGTQVAYQILSGNRVAVKTDLPANTTKTFQLQTGCSPNFSTTNLITMTDTGNYYQISNGLTGVKILKFNNQTRSVSISSVSVSNGTGLITTSKPHKLETVTTNTPMPTAKLPVTISGLTGACSYLNGTTAQVYEAGDIWNPSATQVRMGNISGTNCTDSSGGNLTLSNTIQSPILGVQMPDGSWTDGRGAELRYQNSYGYFNEKALNAKTVQSQILENGPLKIVIKVTYAYNRPAVTFNSERECSTAGLGSAPCSTTAGEGYYTSIISLDAGQKSIMIEDSTDMDFRYSVNFSNQLNYNQGRFRGHHADSYAFGYLADGSVCGGFDNRGSEDCFRDFDSGTFVTPQYNTGANTIAPISAWNPWSNGTGYYWMLYNKDMAGSSPVVGAFAGSTAKAIGVHLSGPAPYNYPTDETGQRQSGFEFVTYRRGPDNTVSLKTTMNWGIFVGTKTADLATPTAVQNINKQMNVLGGFNLNKIYRYITEYPDPAQGYGGLFMPASVVQGIINRLRGGDTSYYNYLYNAEPTARSLVDMWRDGTGAKTAQVASDIKETARNILDTFVNREGIYNFSYQYWHGGLEMSRRSIYGDSVLADPLATSADKAGVKAALATFAYILWDNDFVPMHFDQTKLTAGTANMPIQQEGYRNLYALFLNRHPFLAQKVNGSLANILPTLQSQVNSYGAHMGTSNYIGASLGPTQISLQQAQMSGTNYFASEPRLAQLGEYLMQLSTPPEPRFNNIRKIVAFGDGSTQSMTIIGELGTAFANTNSNLSARLMKIWNDEAKPHDGFHVSTLLTINENLPTADANLKTSNFPGSMSILRNGFGTNSESALWLINGDWYRDHRNDDRGQLMLYALKAPISVSWGPIYYPSASAGTMKNIVMPESNFGSSWKDGNVPLTGTDSGWTSSTNDYFVSFNQSSAANAKMSGNNMTWERKTYSAVSNPDLPIYLIKDTFSGSNAGVSKINQINLMATGDVKTPTGTTTPPIKTYDWYGSLKEQPSSSGLIPLPTGLNKFSFTGQNWSKHYSGGIDFDVYTLSDQAQQATIGNWGHKWHPSSEQNQYQAANGSGFEERQHILRVQGNGSFTTLILPWSKGQKPSGLNVTQDGSDIVITRLGETIRINDQKYSFLNSSKTLLTSFGATEVSGNGITISGGPAEVSLTSNTATITVHGNAGVRTLKLPGTWTVVSGITQSAGVYTINYSGGAPVTFSLSGSLGTGNVDTESPTAPTNLNSSNVGDTSVKINWTASTDNVAVTGYKIFRNNTQIATSSALSFTDSNLVANTTYSYHIVAFDEAGNNSSPSLALSVKTLQQVDTTPPLITAVLVQNIASTTATIVWVTNEPATSLVDFGMSTAYGESVTDIAMVTSHQVNLTNLSPTSNYHFRVRSADGSSNESVSLDQVFTTTQGSSVDQPPAAIVDLTTSRPTRTSITLNWTAPGSDGSIGTASVYDIRYSLSPITESTWSGATLATGEPAPKIAGTKQAYTLVGLTPGTRYYVAIKTYDSAGNASAISNVINFVSKIKGK